MQDGFAIDHVEEFELPAIRDGVEPELQLLRRCQRLRPRLLGLFDLMTPDSTIGGPGQLLLSRFKALKPLLAPEPVHSGYGSL